MVYVQDAVGELLGNMAGAGGRMNNPDRRRARIMQSRGTRVLGDGPQSTSAIAAGPTAPSTQHRCVSNFCTKHEGVPPYVFF